MSLGDIILNIMVFEHHLKIAGCKIGEDALCATKMLFEKYIQYSKAYTLSLHASFIPKIVMVNIDFKLDFPIDRNKLNKLMNLPQYSNIVKISECESTGSSNVNIKIYKKKPENYNYKRHTFINNAFVEDDIGKINPYKPKKKRSTKYTTFIVFSSSKIILSGKYLCEMERAYKFFVTETMKNREFIEEKLKVPEGDFNTFMNED